MDQHVLWVERYRPKTLEEYVFHDGVLKAAVEQMVKTRTIPHLLFSGTAGSGKTTLAQVLIRELDVDPVDVLVLNSSDENSVDIMREKIKTFVSTFAMGDFKVVQLEEADYITPNGQAILRRLMEEYADSARFILTCNYEHKIIPAIKSRCQHFKFYKPDKTDITEFVATILLKEHVKFNIDLLDKYVSTGYPDIRKIINLIQQYSVDEKLIAPNVESSSGDYKFQLLELLEDDQWDKIRTMICENVSGEEWEELYRFVYENLNKAKKFKNKQNWENGIVIIADHLYRHAAIADPEINAAAMFIELSQI